MPHVKFKCDQQKNNMFCKSVLCCFVQPCYIVLYVSLLIKLHNATKQAARQTLHCINQNILFPFISSNIQHIEKCSDRICYYALFSRTLWEGLQICNYNSVIS